jgi:integrase
LLVPDLTFCVLQKWKEQSRSDSPYIFPSLRKPGAPVSCVKTTWPATLRRAGVAHFPIYNLRHAFRTSLSWVVPDPVTQAAPLKHGSQFSVDFYRQVENGRLTVTP